METSGSICTAAVTRLAVGTEEDSGRIHVGRTSKQITIGSQFVNVLAAVAIGITVILEWGAGWWAVRNMPPNAPEDNTVNSAEPPTSNFN